MTENMKTEKIIVSEEAIRRKIFMLRGEQVMLDEDLALIYGYTTKAFNQQVKNNILKFDEDFRFQVTDEEVEELSRSKVLTSMQRKGIKGGRTSNPFVFTEQGIYMLMTVLRGELAISQSKKLIRLFKYMKDYLVVRGDLRESDYFRLSIQTNENTNAIHKIESHMVTKDDLQKFIVNFSDRYIGKEFLIMEGKTIEADVAYESIYSRARKTIYIVDNYVGVKTLLLLKDISRVIKVILFTDNIASDKLTMMEYNDFRNSYPNVNISFKRTNGKFHDRFIVLDYKTRSEKIYHCGASSKDAGKKTTAIMQSSYKELYHSMMDKLLESVELILQ